MQRNNTAEIIEFATAAEVQDAKTLEDLDLAFNIKPGPFGYDTKTETWEDVQENFKYDLEARDFLSAIGVKNALDLAALAQAPDYLVDKLIESDTTGVIGGESGTFKSFFTLELAHCVATGRPFLGRKVKRTGSVLILAGEGGGGYGRRLKALEKRHGPTGRVHVITRCGDLSDSSSTHGRKYIQMVAKAISIINPVLIVYDTFNQLFPKVNNNDSGEVSLAMQHITQLGGMSKSKPTSIFVHHTGKDTTKGLEGSHAFKSNADFYIGLAKKDEYLSRVTSEKEKDGEKFKPFNIEATPTNIGIVDDEGRELSSLTIGLPQTAISLSLRSKPIDKMVGKAKDQTLIAVKSLYKTQVDTIGHGDVIVEMRDVKDFMETHGTVNHHNQNISRLLDDGALIKSGSGYKPA
ncbi:AAA family ATPase [Vibrio cyclitrophicus]